MCYKPLKAVIWSYIEPNTGELKKKVKILKDINKEYTFNNFETLEYLDLPCGKCLECCQDKSIEWSYRIMNEVKFHEQSCFLTLTYRETDGNLCKRDLQLFLKRLRKHLEPRKIRYFACGEYGSKGRRPHFHLIVFGWCPEDLVFFKKTKRNEIIYLSSFLSSVWKHGFVSVGMLSLNSAKYCSKYMQKFNDIPNGFNKPFITMSLKPGIGYKYALENKEKFLEEDKMYVEGSFRKTPRYYVKVFNRLGLDLDYFKNKRLKKAKLFARSDLDNKKIEQKYFQKFGFDI